MHLKLGIRLKLIFMNIKIIVSREKAVCDTWFNFNTTFALNYHTLLSVIHTKLEFPLGIIGT